MSIVKVSMGGQTLPVSVMKIGVSGLSAYQVAVDNGFEGTEEEWLASLQGASGTGSAIVYSFAWGDATPALIVSVPAGKVVFKVELVILTPFDAAASLTIGDSSNHARLFDTDSADLLTAGAYQSNPGHLYASITPINLYLSLDGGVSAGNGLILLYIQE